MAARITEFVRGVVPVLGAVAATRLVAFVVRAAVAAIMVTRTVVVAVTTATAIIAAVALMRSASLVRTVELPGKVKRQSVRYVNLSSFESQVNHRQS